MRIIGKLSDPTAEMAISRAGKDADFDLLGLEMADLGFRYGFEIDEKHPIIFTNRYKVSEKRRKFVKVTGDLARKMEKFVDKDSVIVTGTMPYRFKALLRELHYVCDKKGIRVIGRIILKDHESGFVTIGEW